MTLMNAKEAYRRAEAARQRKAKEEAAARRREAVERRLALDAAVEKTAEGHLGEVAKTICAAVNAGEQEVAVACNLLGHSRVSVETLTREWNRVAKRVAGALRARGYRAYAEKGAYKAIKYFVRWGPVPGVDDVGDADAATDD